MRLDGTHCPKGHELVGDNLLTKRGYRQCRTCKNNYNLEWKRKKYGTLPRPQIIPVSAVLAVMDERTLNRFWSKVAIGGPDECWPWLKSKSNGYGQFKVGGAYVRAPRFSLMLKLGRELRSDEVARHHCDNPTCVNPRHLIEGSHQDNIRDAVSRGRMTGPHSDRKGEANPRARMTSEMVIALRKERATTGATYASLADKYGLSPSSIRSAIIGERWQHVQ